MNDPSAGTALSGQHGIDAAAAYYRAIEAPLEMRFLTALDDTIERVLDNPLQYQRIGRRARRASIARFPYGLVYTLSEQDLIVLACMAGNIRADGTIASRTLSIRKLEAMLHAAERKPRGRLLLDEPIAPLTWFRVGGPAEALFMPEDEEDLAYFLGQLPADIPVTVIGLGSNLIVRDGGVPGVVVRLGRGFNSVRIEEGFRIRTGTAVPDVKVARAAQEASVAGLSFYRGIPGAIGGALRMNGGAYGNETKDVLIEARGVDRSGVIRVYANAEMGYSYRHCSVADDVIFTQALFQGAAGNAAMIASEMDKITEAREATQPIKSRTGGSTFKNPPGHKAWQLIDAAGCRGLRVGGAQVSELHCNFLLNLGEATAHDIETLGETVRSRVMDTSGVQLEWEIKRIGIAALS